MWVMMVIMGFPIIGLTPFLVVSWKAALPLYLAGVAISVVYHRAMMQSGRLPVRTGRAGMIGGTGTVSAWGSGRGSVRCRGEIWAARAENGEMLPVGTMVEIASVQNLELVVRPVREERQDGPRRRQAS